MLSSNKDLKAEKHSISEASLHGDVLEAVLTCVPLINLVPACHVSRTWNVAVSSSLRHLNPIKPWLILNAQSTRPPYSTTTHAYDPRTNHWLQITHDPIKYVSTLCSSSSTLLYMINPSKFSFSYDPLHLTWHHIEVPLCWRTDPIVALVDCHVIIAGGTCELEDDPLAVEVYNIKTQVWETCASIPEIFQHCCATSALSITTTSEKMYVVEKSSGVCFYFNPRVKSWSGPYNLFSNKVFCVYLIGCINERLIVIHIEENKEGRIERVKMYGLNDISMELGEEIGEMPERLVEKMNGDDMYFTGSISVNMKGNLVYLINNSVPEEVFVCEVGGGDGGACKWWSVRNIVVDDRCRVSKRLVFSCSDVNIGVLERAMADGCKNFDVKPLM